MFLSVMKIERANGTLHTNGSGLCPFPISVYPRMRIVSIQMSAKFVLVSTEVTGFCKAAYDGEWDAERGRTMYAEIAKGLLLPLLGTSLGAAGVLFVKKAAPKVLSAWLNDAAAGVMIAASIFSLLLPAMEASEADGACAWLPACVGFLLGAGLLAAWDVISARLEHADGVGHSTRMLVLSVSLHNIPEGMAVGAAYAALLSGSTTVTVMSAFSLSLGIALQNLPEGAIISLPLHADGVPRKKAFALGVLSGVSEPIAGGLTILLAYIAVPILPWLLSFAAGAMAYVTGFELLPATWEERPRVWGMLFVLGGFMLMTAMDLLLG